MAEEEESAREGVARVQRAIAKAGVKAVVFAHAAPAKSSAEAARVAGVAVSDILKTIAVRAGEKTALFLLPGDRRLDLTKAAALLGEKKARLATPQEVRATLGYEVGGVPPAGHDKDLPVFLEESVLEKKEVVACGGSARHGLRIAPCALLKLACARPASFALPR